MESWARWEDSAQRDGRLVEQAAAYLWAAYALSDSLSANTPNATARQTTNGIQRARTLFM
jgi:hypothetical protein